MTEADVRALFFKNYNGGDLNEALMVTIEEIMMITLKECTEQPESLPEIVGTIVIGKSHVALFARMTNGTNPVVPMHYLVYFDQIRKAMMDVVRYVCDNLEFMDPWLRKQFTKENLKMMSADLARVIEKVVERPVNVRAFHSGELKLYNEFFNKALIGIIGPDQFHKYAKEYNRYTDTLRRCQIECQAFNSMVGRKES